MFAVITSSHEGQVGLVVDSLVGEMEIVIKSLGSFIGNIPGVWVLLFWEMGGRSYTRPCERVVEERHDAGRVRDVVPVGIGDALLRISQEMCLWRTGLDRVGLWSTICNEGGGHGPRGFA